MRVVLAPIRALAPTLILAGALGTAPVLACDPSGLDWATDVPWHAECAGSQTIGRAANLPIGCVFAANEPLFGPQREDMRKLPDVLWSWHAEAPQVNPFYNPDLSDGYDYFVSREDLDALMAEFERAAVWLRDRCAADAALARISLPNTIDNGVHVVRLRPRLDWDPNEKDGWNLGTYSLTTETINIDLPIIGENNGSDQLALGAGPRRFSYIPAAEREAFPTPSMRATILHELVHAVTNRYVDAYNGDEWLFEGLADGLAMVYLRDTDGTRPSGSDAPGRYGRLPLALPTRAAAGYATMDDYATAPFFYWLFGERLPTDTFVDMLRSVRADERAASLDAWLRDRSVEGGLTGAYGEFLEHLHGRDPLGAAMVEHVGCGDVDEPYDMAPADVMKEWNSKRWSRKPRQAACLVIGLEPATEARELSIVWTGATDGPPEGAEHTHFIVDGRPFEPETDELALPAARTEPVVIAAFSGTRDEFGDDELTVPPWTLRVAPDRTETCSDPGSADLFICVPYDPSWNCPTGGDCSNRPDPGVNGGAWQFTLSLGDTSVLRTVGSGEAAIEPSYEPAPGFADVAAGAADDPEGLALPGTYTWFNAYRDSENVTIEIDAPENSPVRVESIGMIAQGVAHVLRRRTTPCGETWWRGPDGALGVDKAVSDLALSKTSGRYRIEIAFTPRCRALGPGAEPEGIHVFSVPEADKENSALQQYDRSTDAHQLRPYTRVGDDAVTEEDVETVSNTTPVTPVPPPEPSSEPVEDEPSWLRDASSLCEHSEVVATMEGFDGAAPLEERGGRASLIEEVARYCAGAKGDDGPPEAAGNANARFP